MTDSVPELPKDPNWCPKAGEVFREGWFTIAVVSVEPIVNQGRTLVQATFVVQNGDEQANLQFQASPVGNGRAFRSAILKAISALAVQ